MEGSQRHALGFVGESLIRAAGDFFRNVDVVALTIVSCDAARRQGRGRSPFPTGSQSTDRARVALHGARRRVSGLEVLRSRRVQREESVVDRHARPLEVSSTSQLPDAAGRTEKRRRDIFAQRRRVVTYHKRKCEPD